MTVQTQRPPSGTRVRVLAATHTPPHGLQGREGKTYRPSDEGTYVRFDDGSYCFLWWDEIEEAHNTDRDPARSPGDAD